MGIEVKCGKCSTPVPPSDVNVGEGVAFCRRCSAVTRLGDLVETHPLSGIDANDPPRGCSIIENGSEVIVRACPRSVGGALVLLFAAAFWNGIVSVFVLVVTRATIEHATGGVPTWMASLPGDDGATMPLPMVIFMWLFLTPFIVIGMGLIWAAAVAMVGRQEVRLRDGQGTIFTGVGPLGFTRCFDALAATSVRIDESTSSKNNQTTRTILINADKEIRFGSMLPKARQMWMAAMLRKLLTH